MSHPGNFGGEALNVVLLSLQHIFRHKQRERAVLDTHLLDVRVEPLLNLLPDREGGRLKLIVSVNVEGNLEKKRSAKRQIHRRHLP